MTDQHEWPTAPIIQAVWVTPLFEETALTGVWTRVRDGVYYSTYRGYVARKGEGYFTNVTEYWPRDFRKDEVQRLQRALRERTITIAALREELEEYADSPLPDREEVKKALELEFGSFLAHDPAYPDLFWGQAADEVLALFTATPCAPDPTTFVFPHEPEGPIWDKNGNKWVRIDKDTWERTNAVEFATWLGLLERLGPLTSTPPANQAWHVGDKINTPEEADTLPGKTIIHDNRQYYAQKYKNQWFGPGHSDAIEAREFEYPLTIIWLPEEGE